ncbi:MAG: hypothetical protein ACF8XB_17150 [Planctomycetota bacterium JB042]
MSLAALCLGIVSFAVAALVSAPFFWLVAFAGVPLAAVGVVVSILAYVQLFRLRRARRPIEPGSLGHATWGLSLSLVAILWQAGLLFLWGNLTM